MTETQKIDKKSDENPPKSARKVPFFILWPELRFWNLISGPHFRPSIQALISGPHFRPSFQAHIYIEMRAWNEGLKWGPEMRARNEGLKWGFRTSIQAKGWKMALFGGFSSLFSSFVCFYVGLMHARFQFCKKNQSNSFIFDAGALFQKFLTI